MLKIWANPMGFLDSSLADGGGANWTVLGQKKMSYCDLKVEM